LEEGLSLFFQLFSFQMLPAQLQVHPHYMALAIPHLNVLLKADRLMETVLPDLEFAVSK